MDCSRTTKLRLITLALLLAAGFYAVPAGAQGDGGAPAPANADAQAASTGKSTLQEMKEELFGPSRPYGSGAIDRLMNDAPQRVTPVLPRVDGEKTRLSRQREDEWIFSDLNDLNSKPSLESLAGLPDYGPDGQDRNKLSPMERYLDGLDQKRGTGSNYLNNVTGMMWNQKEFSGSNGMNSMTFMLPGMNGSPEDLTASASSNSAAADKHDPGSGFTDSAPPTDTAAVLDQQRRLEDFKRLLSPDSPGFAPASPMSGSPSGRFSDLLNFGAPAVPAGVPAAAPAGYPGSPSPALGSVNAANPGYHSSMNVTQPTTFTVPGATRLTTLPPPPAPTSKPVSLDPFMDNLPKRSF